MARLAAAIRVEIGPGFTARALDDLAYALRFKLDYIRPGKPADNIHPPRLVHHRHSTRG